MKYNVDCHGGAVFGEKMLTPAQADLLAGKNKPADHDYVIVGIATQTGEGVDGTPYLRHYYALNLAQAIAKAAQLAITLPQLESRWTLIDIRRATEEETNMFFRLIDNIEAVNATSYTSEEIAKLPSLRELIERDVRQLLARNDDPSDGDWNESKVP